MRPTPFQAYRADHDRLRQVLHLLHRAQRPRPGAEPAARAHRRRGPRSWPTRAARRSRCSARRSTATSYRERRPHDAAVRPARRAARHRRASSGSSSSPTIPKDMTDDLLEAVRDLPKVLAVPARAGPERLRTRCCKRMKRGYTVEDYREMLARIRETVPDAAVTSDFIVGFCGETEDDFQKTLRPGARVPVQEQLHLQVQRAARHQGRRAVRRRRARGGQEAPQQRAAGDAEPRSARRTTSRSSAGTVEVLVEGPSKARQKHATKTGRHRAAHRPHALRPDRGLRRQPRGRSARCCRSTIYDANAHTLFGAVVTQHVGPELFTLGVIAVHLHWRRSRCTRPNS